MIHSTRFGLATLALAAAFVALITFAPAAGAGGAADAVTVAGRADVPPMGALLNTVADDRGTITLNGAPVTGTAESTKPTTEDCTPGAQGVGCTNYASYAVFNRQTLQLVASGSLAPNIPGTKDLLKLADTYDKAPTYLMVVNVQGLNGYPEDGKKLLERLGVAKMSIRDLEKTPLPYPISIVGVPGSPAGSAFISDHFLKCECAAARHLANMSGYLRLNPASATGGYFEFVLADQVEFSTDASPVPKQITMKVGDKTYAHDVPTNGSSGFFLVRLHSRTLALDRDFFYVTNKPDGSQDPSEAKRMADDLAWASSTKNDHGELLVMLQAFGTPKGTSPGWLAAARAIARLGGNGQLFAQLNLGGAEEPHQGRLAFVGHSAMDTFAAESSQSLTGHADDALLDGLLARGRDDQYEPLAAGPVGGVNFDLVRIVNRPSLPGGGFPTFAGGQAAAADFLGRNPNAIGVCDQAEVTCDVRKEYYLDYGADWATILTRLGQANLCPSGGGTDAAGTAFTKDDCNAVREEFFAEIGDRNKVEQYFGPKGLQAPFLGGGGAGAIVDITKLANEITTAVEPPKANNAVSDALGLLSNIAKVAAFSALVCPPCGPVAGGLTGSFAIAAYATKQNGSADLIGPKVVAKAADLGVDLFDRYRAASSNFTTEAMIVMSDWSKLREVAAAVDTKKWRLGYTATAEAQIRLATKQVIYEALLPVAYPILYDLGTGITHASYWRCIGNKGNKTLFQQSGTGTEVFWRMSDPSFLGEDHLIVVGAHHAVGHLSGAYIPSPPESVTGPLFRDSAEGGIGLYKLDFYSPQYFRSFPGSPQVFQQSDETSGPFKKEYGFHNCDAMPDPPGNSG